MRSLTGCCVPVSRSQAGLSIFTPRVCPALAWKFLDHGLALPPARLDSRMPVLAAGPCRLAHRALGLAQSRLMGSICRARQRAPPVCGLGYLGPPPVQTGTGAPRPTEGGHPLPRGEGRAGPWLLGTAELPFEALFTAGGPAVGTRAQGPGCRTRAGRAWHGASLEGRSPALGGQGAGAWGPMSDRVGPSDAPHPLPVSLGFRAEVGGSLLPGGRL